MRRMVLALIALILPASAAAECPEVAAPLVELRPGGPPAQLIRELAAHELPQPSTTGLTSASPLARQVGSTVWQLAIKSRFDVEEVADAPGCFRLTTIRAQILADPVNVFIARELDEESCPYIVTLALERRHVAIVNDAVDAIAGDLEIELRDTSLARAIETPDIATAVRRFRSAINVIVGDTRRRAHEDATRRNALLDTPEAYRAEQAKCTPAEWSAPFE